MTSPVAHGVDVVDLEDFKRLMLPDFLDQLKRMFTDAELAAAGDGPLRTERLAGRLAVKEAVMKALRRGFGDGVAFTDVETVNDAAGAPSIVLRGVLERDARAAGVERWLVSTSHAGNVVLASVIALAHPS